MIVSCILCCCWCRSQNNCYPVISLPSLILASSARLSPSLSLDQCLETLVSDSPSSSSHLSGGAPPLPGPVGGQLSCPLQRLSVPIASSARASLPKVATSLRLIAPLSPSSPCGGSGSPPSLTDSLRPSSLSSCGRPPSTPFEWIFRNFSC